RPRALVLRPRLAVERHVPVAADVDPVGVHDREMSGLQLPDALEPGARARHVPLAEVVPEGVGIELRAYAGPRQQRADLGREEERPVAGPRVVERLDAERIAREEQPAPPPVPDPER